MSEWTLFWGGIIVAVIILGGIVGHRVGRWIGDYLSRRDEHDWRHDPAAAARYRSDIAAARYPSEMRTEWNTDWQRAGGGAVPGELIGKGVPPSGWIGRSASNIVISQTLQAELSRWHATDEPMWPRP